MALSAVPDLQSAFDEEIVEDAEPERSLEAREKAKEAAGEARKAYAAADEKAKAAIEAHELEEDSVLRCGRFRVAKRAIPARSIAFETSPSSRLSIRVIE